MRRMLRMDASNVPVQFRFEMGLPREGGYDSLRWSSRYRLTSACGSGENGSEWKPNYLIRKCDDRTT